MSSVNKVIVLGRVGKDPDVKYVPNGDCIVNITVATSEKWKDKTTGEQKETTEWHRIVFYRKLAEIVAKYILKGSLIYIEGKLQTRMWEKDGTKHYSTEIIAEKMQMVGSGPKQESSGSSNEPAKKVSGDFEDFESDVPF